MAQSMESRSASIQLVRPTAHPSPYTDDQVVSHGLDGHLPFRRVFRTQFLTSLPPSFPDAFRSLVRSVFEANATTTTTDSSNSSSSPLHTMLDQLDTLGILEDFESLISPVLVEQIRTKVMETCPKEWGEPQLAKLRAWFNERAVPWMAATYARGASDSMCARSFGVFILCFLIGVAFADEQLRATLQPIAGKFDYHMCKILCDLR